MSSRSFRRLLIVVTCLIAALLSVPCQCQSGEIAEATSAPDETAVISLREFVDTSYAELIRYDPDSLWAWGVAEDYGINGFSVWSEVSLEAVKTCAALAAEILDELRTYEREPLTRPERIVFDAYEWFLEDYLQRANYPYWDYVIGLSSYGVHNIAFDVMVELPIDDEARAEAYVRRIEGIDEWMDQLIDVYRAREASGVIPTEYAIEMTLMDLDNAFPPDEAGGVDPRSLAVFTSFADRLSEVESLTSADRRRLQDEAIAAIEANLIPAYRAFRDYVASLNGRGTAVGVIGYEGATEYYEYLLAHHVTKPMTPEEVHAIGKREVQRLQEEMHDYATDVLGWPESGSGVKSCIAALASGGFA